MGEVLAVRSDFALATSEDLLLRVQDGDRAAFSTLYDLFAPKIFALLRRILVDHHQAEEVCQEVFLEIWQGAMKFDPARGGAAGWIMTIAHRRGVDRVRASQASRNRDLKIGIRDHEDTYDDVTGAVEITFENERVRLALFRLTDLQRQAVTLTYYNGYSNAETADILHVPIGTMKTRLRDGLIRLRDELGVTA